VVDIELVQSVPHAGVAGSVVYDLNEQQHDPRGAATPVAVKIKLMRLGKIRAPYYRIVVADARNRRSGRAIETIGKYHPKSDPSFIEVDSERAQYWLGVGAQPTDPVRNILEITGDWQKFKGLPGTEGTLRQPAPPVDRLARFNAALAEAGGEVTGDATTARKRSEPRPKKDAEPKAEAKAEPKAEAKAEPKAEAKAEPKAEAKAEPEPEAKAEPEPEPEAKAEPKAEAKAEPEPESKPESSAQAGAANAEGGQ
jgi:small subunit ribosomal protein S16